MRQWLSWIAQAPSKRQVGGSSPSWRTIYFKDKEVSYVVQPIKFETKEDLYRFSELASQEDYNIYISTALGQLDAKSLLALFTILGTEVNIVAPDHADADKFLAFLDKFNSVR